jgi:hypothetical protein
MGRLTRERESQANSGMPCPAGGGRPPGAAAGAAGPGCRPDPSGTSRCVEGQAPQGSRELPQYGAGSHGRAGPGSGNGAGLPREDMRFMMKWVRRMASAGESGWM